MKQNPHDAPPEANRIKEQARRLREYLRSQGFEVSPTQSQEAVSRAVHGKPWNTARHLTGAAASQDSRIKGRANDTTGATLVLPRGSKPLATQDLVRITAVGTYYLDVVVFVGIWELIDSDVEAVNDLVSELITGSIVGLQDISYSRYDGAFAPESLGGESDAIPVRVTAAWCIDAVEEDLEDYLDVEFAWVYPDEDGSRVPAVANRKTGEVVPKGELPADIPSAGVRTRLENDAGEMVDVHFDAVNSTWRVRRTDLSELADW